MITTAAVFRSDRRSSSNGSKDDQLSTMRFGIYTTINLTREADSSPTPFFGVPGLRIRLSPLPGPTTGRTLDEYELTGPLRRWQEDIGLIAELGVQTARYGIPWHRINPRAGSGNGNGPIVRLSVCSHSGIQPIVDLGSLRTSELDRSGLFESRFPGVHGRIRGPGCSAL